MRGASTIKIKDISSKVNFVAVNSFAFIGTEIVRVDAINIGTSEITIGRGCLDTTPKKWPVDTLVYFAEDYSNIARDIIPTGTALKLKALPSNGSERLPIGSAPELDYIMDYRQGDLRVNALSYPEAVVGPIVLAWAHRDRFQQLVRPIIDHTAGNIGPEAGTTYQVSVFDETGTTLIAYLPSTSATTWAWITETSDIAGKPFSRQLFRVGSVRGSFTNHQSAEWVVERTGAGYNLGNYLGGI